MAWPSRAARQLSVSCTHARPLRSSQAGFVAGRRALCHHRLRSAARRATLARDGHVARRAPDVARRVATASTPAACSSEHAAGDHAKRSKVCWRFARRLQFCGAWARVLLRAAQAQLCAQQALISSLKLQARRRAPPRRPLRVQPRLVRRAVRPVRPP